MKAELGLLTLAKDQPHTVRGFQSGHGQVEWLLENN